MTELEKLLAGELYDYSDAEIAQLHGKAYYLSMKINNNLTFDNLEEMKAALSESRVKLASTMPNVSRFDEVKLLQKELLPNMDETSTVLPPFRCDLGFRIMIGRNVTVNQNCTFLDNAPIEIGDNCLIGPDCHFYTPQHPFDYEQRRKPMEKSLPIKIGQDTWIGGNVTICPRVTIGERCIVGAGSVVTHDVDSDTMVAGNPARVIRKLNQQ